jgi:hypothetical protein
MLFEAKNVRSATGRANDHQSSSNDLERHILSRRKRRRAMLKKSLSFLIAAGVLTLGLNAFAQEVNTDVTTPQDQTQIRDRKMDGTGDQDKDRIMKQDHDRTAEHQGSGSGTGKMKQSSGSGVKGGRGGGRR